MQAHVSVVGLDIAKSDFQVHAADATGKVILRRKLKRAEVEPFFRTLEPCLVAREACPGSHFWARLLRNFGHDVRLLPAQYVRPYVKTNRSDAADAEAICEAVTRPTILVDDTDDQRTILPDITQLSAGTFTLLTIFSWTGLKGGCVLDTSPQEKASLQDESTARAN